MVTIHYSKSVGKQSQVHITVEEIYKEQIIVPSRETYVSARRSLREELKDIKKIKWEKAK